MIILLDLRCESALEYMANTRVMKRDCLGASIVKMCCHLADTDELRRGTPLRSHRVLFRLHGWKAAGPEALRAVWCHAV